MNSQLVQGLSVAAGGIVAVEAAVMIVVVPEPVEVTLVMIDGLGTIVIGLLVVFRVVVTDELWIAVDVVVRLGVLDVELIVLRAVVEVTALETLTPIVQMNLWS